MIYFASDLHLGYPDFDKSLVREKLFVAWLDEIKADATEIFLMGDIFDFWFEYKRVVPRGFTRMLGKIAEITDIGIPVHYFTGNHDVWVFDYLPKEIGVKVHRHPINLELRGKKFHLAHGDGLGPNDHSFKLLKRLFTSSLAQFLFAKIHPNPAMRFGLSWSHRRRHTHQYESFKGYEQEWLVIYAKEKLQAEHFDHFIFGHRHHVYQYQLNTVSKLTNLGDWLSNFSYAVFDGNDVILKYYKSK